MSEHFQRLAIAVTKQVQKAQEEDVVRDHRRGQPALADVKDEDLRDPSSRNIAYSMSKRKKGGFQDNWLVLRERVYADVKFSARACCVSKTATERHNERSRAKANTIFGCFLLDYLTAIAFHWTRTPLTGNFSRKRIGKVPYGRQRDNAAFEPNRTVNNDKKRNE
ncbi:uncharacterized protein KY384_008868 [Bacidia gigantensis]|uniref:uncharacterized protein n=1 Tax=Bacidia gigantensis TaxID=2732470 RepID=UPI001D04A03A|nr:uncharacterized protein KY384_008868 [Bacidia gigantensis]KAG8525224.1 hypothetical protein KY384_008868 [Bacidia gigantensis]